MPETDWQQFAKDYLSGNLSLDSLWEQLGIKEVVDNVQSAKGEEDGPDSPGTA